MLEDLLNQEDIELVNMMLYYSEIPAEKYSSFLGKITARIEQHITARGGLNRKELYSLIRGTIGAHGQRKKDRVDFALPIGSSNIKIGSEHPSVEDDLLAKDRKPIYVLKLEETFDFLKRKLTLNEYNFIVRWLNNDPLFFSRRMPFTVEYVSKNLDLIRDQIALILKSSPDPQEFQRVYAMSLEKILEPYVLATYKKVMRGMEKSFPKGFLITDGKKKMKIIAHYLLEDILKLEQERIPEVISTETFKQHHLWGALATVFSGSVVKLMDYAYEGCFQPWEFKRVPFNYWQGEEGRKHTIEAVKWLVVEKLGISKLSEVPLKLNKHVFKEYGLEGMLSNRHNNSTYQAVNETYPERFKPWEFERVPLNYWCGPDGQKHAEEAMKWLIEDKLQIDSWEIPQKLRHKEFRKYRLLGMLKFCYENKVYNAVNALYPGRFRVWEIKRVENSFWEGEEGQKHAWDALEWLVEKKLSHPDPREIPQKVTEKLFSRFGLGGLLQVRFGGSVAEAVNLVYQNFYPTYMMP